MLKIYFVIVLLFHLLILTIIRFTAWPEMFSYPYLINNGFKPYLDIAFPYEPLLPLILSFLYQIFGYDVKVLQYFTWGLIILCDLLLFIISRKVIGERMYSLLPVMMFVASSVATQSNMLWFDLATTPLILLGVTTFVCTNSLRKYFFLGLFLSLGFFVKQQLGIAIALLVLYLLFSQYRLAKLKYFILGFLVPAAVVLFYITFNDIIFEYVFWTISVPLYWYPQFPGYTHFPSRNDLVAIILMITPATYFIIKGYKKLQEENIVVLILLAGALLSALPRFEFFRMQPAVALICVITAFAIALNRYIGLILLTSIILSVALLVRYELPILNQQPRFYSEQDLRLTKELRLSSERILNVYLLNISSLQYVLAEKLPSKPWVDNYVWYLEIPGMQEKVIEGFKQNPPQTIFQKNPSLGNWFDLGTYQPQKVIDYINAHYEKKNIIDGEVQVWELKN